MSAPNTLEVAALTPLIGGEVTGLDLTQPLEESALRVLTDAFIEHKVLVVRSGGAWRMTVDEHTRLCQQLSAHWGLKPSTPQQHMNHSGGLTVHPFLPWVKRYPHVWPTGSVAGGGMQHQIRDREEVENFAPFSAFKTARRAKPKADQGKPRPVSSVSLQCHRLWCGGAGAGLRRQWRQWFPLRRWLFP